MRTRDIRSASHASGTAPSTSATPPNALMPISVVSLMWSVSWMSGREHSARGPLELLGDRDQREHDHHRRAAGAQRLAHRHRLGADAGQQVVGQDVDRGPCGLLLLPLRLLGEHRRRERGRVRVAGVGLESAIVGRISRPGSGTRRPRG